MQGIVTLIEDLLKILIKLICDNKDTKKEAIQIKLVTNSNLNGVIDLNIIGLNIL